MGKGFTDARMVLVGEAPGAHEDAAGLPFVGPSGVVLDKILKGLGLKYKGKNVPEDRRVFLTNVVRCRPRDGQRNRAPKPDEILACRPWLEETLRMINPNILVMIGRISEAAIIGRRGFAYPMVMGNLVVYEVTHPAAYLRNTKSMDKDLELWTQIAKDLTDCVAAGAKRPRSTYTLPLLLHARKEASNG